MKKLKTVFINLLRILPDKTYLRLLYLVKCHHKLNLLQPSLFSEKLQWLKIYDRKAIYSIMADKYEAKLFVSKIVGEDVLVKNYGCWDSFDEIDFDALPNQFVLKCTHDSGGVVICKDKKEFNYNEARKKINKCLKRSLFYIYREWPYKNIKPRIIAEQYLSTDDGSPLIDYKFYCFNGEPRFLYISKGLDDHSKASISFVNLDWTFSKYKRSDFKQFDSLPIKPKRFEEMIAISRELAKGTYFLRVDLYNLNGRIYFSELTFFPCGGFMPFTEETHDAEIGKMLNLDTANAPRGGVD